MNQIVSYKHQSNLRRHLVLDLEQSKIGLMDYYSGKWLGKNLLQYCALISHSYEFLLHCFLSWPKFAICWTLLEICKFRRSRVPIQSLKSKRITNFRSPPLERRTLNWVVDFKYLFKYSNEFFFERVFQNSLNIWMV